MAESLRSRLEKLQVDLAEKIPKIEKENQEAEMAMESIHQQEMRELKQKDDTEKLAFIGKQDKELKNLKDKHCQELKQIEEKHREQVEKMKEKENKDRAAFEAHQLTARTHLEEKHHKERNQLKERSETKLKNAEDSINNMMSTTPTISTPRRATECPVCWDPMDPPKRIFQCGQGHYICEPCRNNPQIKSCPSCRQPITGRNIGMEHAILALVGGQSANTPIMQSGSYVKGKQPASPTLPPSEDKPPNNLINANRGGEQDGEPIQNVSQPVMVQGSRHHETLDVGWFEDCSRIRNASHPVMVRAPAAVNRLPSSVQPSLPPPAQRPQSHAPGGRGDAINVTNVEMNKCLEGHILQHTLNGRNWMGWTCDGCGGGYFPGNPRNPKRYRCRPCDYDLCENCYHSNGEQDGEPIRKVSHPVVQRSRHHETYDWRRGWQQDGGGENLRETTNFKGVN